MSGATLTAGCQTLNSDENMHIYNRRMKQSETYGKKCGETAKKGIKNKK